METTVAIIFTDEFGQWFDSLQQTEQVSVINVVAKLELRGIALGTPHSSALAGTASALRELRPKSGQSPLRIVYAFDPARDAVLILGGDKSGGSTASFYADLLARSEKIWAIYLSELAGNTSKTEKP